MTPNNAIDRSAKRQRRLVPVALRTPAPRIGEHNEALLKPLLGAAEYDKLCAAGTISKGKKK